MASTYTPIATTTLSSDANNIYFSSIPQTYTDLILVCSAKSAYTGANTAEVYTYINNDSTNSYSRTRIWSSTSSVYSDRNTNQGLCLFGEIPANGSSIYGVTIVHFMNYSNTTTYKTVISRNGAADNNAQGNAYVNLYRNTNAISVLSIYNTSGSNFKAGSTFTLYGIKAA